MKKALLAVASVALLGAQAFAQTYTFKNNTDCNLQISFFYAASCGGTGAGVGMLLPANSTVTYPLPAGTVLTRVDLSKGGTLTQQWHCNTGDWHYITAVTCTDVGPNSGVPIGTATSVSRANWVLNYDIAVGNRKN
ncbi:MAG: hypothetical protein JSR24_23995 [Proteobacteria bacterium]|nr:hypothetical protein [Pseudomonadota bacterium]